MEALKRPNRVASKNPVAVAVVTVPLALGARVNSNKNPAVVAVEVAVERGTVEDLLRAGDLHRRGAVKLERTTEGIDD